MLEQKVWAPDVTCYVTNQGVVTLPDGREINCFAFPEDFRFDHLTDFEVAEMFHQICKGEMKFTSSGGESYAWLEKRDFGNPWI